MKEWELFHFRRNGAIVVKRLHHHDEIKLCCFLSPSARYGVQITRTDVPDFRPLETHFYNYHFIVFDFILDTGTEYVSKCSPFKRFHRFYFLNDSFGVLVDFSRNNGSITQNVIRFYHENCLVTSDCARVWNFSVDDMLFETDNTHLIKTTAMMEYNNNSYLPLLGIRDGLRQLIYARIVPANPFQSNYFNAPLLTITKQDAYQRTVQSEEGLLDVSDLCTDKRCYPLIHGTSLYFIMKLRSHPMDIFPDTCVAMLKIDFKNYFDTHFAMTTQFVTTILPLRWATLPQQHKTYPRLVKVMAQDGEIAILKDIISDLSQSWILVNLKTMTMTPLNLEQFSKHDYVTLDKNRLIFQQHQHCAIFIYDFVWIYNSIPKLKHLAFWRAVTELKKLRSKKCWQFHLAVAESCMACNNLEFITRLLLNSCEL